MDQKTAIEITNYAKEYCIGTFIGNAKLSKTDHFYIHFIDDDLLFSTPIGAVKFIEAITEERKLLHKMIVVDVSKAC